VDRGWGKSRHYSAWSGEKHTFDSLSKREFFSLLCPDPKGAIPKNSVPIINPSTNDLIIT
jgi:hypothetical protein